MWNTILYETKERIAHITINRPKVLNAINLELMEELPKALKRAEADPAIRVIVLGAAGRSFGAGYDLKMDWAAAYGGRGPMSTRAMLTACAEFEMAVWRCEKPVIAMVRGHCVAGSCELAMLCCLTMASENAIFGEPEIRFSTAPPVVVMPWIVGLKKARELLYTGDPIDAKEALRLGMVNHVVPDDKLEEETFRLARRMATIEVEGLKTTKAAINRGAEISGFVEAVNYGIETGAILDATPTELYLKFKEITKTEGLSAAVRWRESQFAEKK
ncbi:MAG: enoyl-CoA hydratase/isomerase family protein [Alphaproteobacteria bacterium]|nr:enoyl-CoA hydratase/isomerase family protein [Alphaproteobacteria bacterium]